MSASFWAFKYTGGPKRLIIGQLYVEAEPSDVDSSGVEKSVSRHLARHRLELRPAAEDAETWRLHVALVEQGRHFLSWAQAWGETHAVPESIAAGGHAIEVRLERIGAQLAPYFRSTVPLQPAATLQAALDRSVSRGLEVVRAQRSLADLGIEQLLPWLDEAKARVLAQRYRVPGNRIDMQAFVVEELGRRRDQRATTALMGLLSTAQSYKSTDADHLLALRAVGALVLLRDQRAVLPIIAMAQRQRPEVVAQMAHAVGALGGRMAKSYLWTLASGHEHDLVREAAEAALAGLEEFERRSP